MTISDEPRSTGAVRLHQIAAGLTAVGLVTHLHRTRAGTDLTATLSLPGCHEIEVIADEDGYTELRYWCSLNSAPATYVATIARLLEAIVASQSPGQSRKAGIGAGCRLRWRGHRTCGRLWHDGAPRPSGRAGTNPRPSTPAPGGQPSRQPGATRRLTGPPGAVAPQPPLVPLPRRRFPPAPRPRGGRGRGGPAPDPELADHPRTAPDGSWDWKGRKLAPERASIADEAITSCREKEGRDMNGNYGDHGLTPAMRRLETQLDHGHLIEDTEKFALKDPDRFKEKFAKLIERYPGADPTELAAGIADGIRYTVVFDFDYYTAGVAAGHTQLKDAGYERIETKPSWGSDQYKGVNSQWREPSAGVMFEVQFHTEESWDAKQKTHAAYERIQAPGTSVEEVEQLRDYQRWVSAHVRIPQGALEIEPYKKEGQVGA
jgi:hypothetical protein